MNKISKFAGVFVAVAFAVAVATPASAMTTAELTSLLKGLGVSDSVIASVTAAQGGSTVSTGTCGSFTKDLTLGSTGAEVVSLQDFLVAQGKLTIPAGVSKGYFGAMTQKALAAYQAANAITPAAGYFGPITRAKVSAACGTTGSTGSTGSTGTLQGGEGDFKNFKMLGTPSSEDVYEGATTKVVGYEFTAKDSDLMIDRVELRASSTSAGKTSKPWKVLDEINILNGSKEIASIDASQKDNWEEIGSTGVYTIKITGIKSVVKEDEKAKLYVEVKAMDSLDTTDFGNWDIGLTTDGIRATDAAGLDLYEGTVTDVKSFTLKTAEAGDMTISVDTSTDNKARTVAVDDQNKTTDELAYLAKVKSKTGTNNVDKVAVTLTGSDTLSDIIDTVYLYIDGEEVGSESADSTVTFSDLNYDISEGDKLDFEVKYDLNDTNDGARYSNGATTTVTGMTVYYTDSNDDDATVSTSVDGGIMTYSTSSVNVTLASVPTATTPIANDESKGRVYVSFEVSAPEDEAIYIPKGATTTSTVSSGKGAYFKVVDGSGSNATATTTASGNLLTANTGATESGNYWKISEGGTAKFTLDVIIDNNGGAAAQTVGVQLLGVNYNVGAADTANVQFTSGLDETFRSGTVYLLTSNTSN